MHNSDLPLPASFESTVPGDFPYDTLLLRALPDLKLNIAQTANLCGISVRQLGYWTKQGYVTAAGRDDRRLYGLDAVHRLLAIRHAMSAGASLRQALARVSQGPPVISDVSAGNGSYEANFSASETTALSPDYAEALEASLIALYNTYGSTRDNAAGLAAKVGRSEEDVRVAVEALCALGVLTRTEVQGEWIYLRAEGVSE